MRSILYYTEGACHVLARRTETGVSRADGYHTSPSRGAKGKIPLPGRGATSVIGAPQPAPALAGQAVAFTGKLGAITRKEALRQLAQARARLAERVTRRTDMLVVGMGGWPILPSGEISQKLEKAEHMRRQGHPLKIVPEVVFLELLGLHGQTLTLSKPYSDVQVIRFLGIDREELHRWEYFGLVRPENGHYDFQDLVSLKNLLSLTRQGLRIEKIAQALNRMCRLLPCSERPLGQLRLLAMHADSLTIEVGGIKMEPSGQLVMDFDSEGPGSDLLRLNHDATTVALFEAAQHFEASGQKNEARDAYRRIVALAPDFAEAHYNLGNLEREFGRQDAAEQAYRHAVALAPDMASAWYNLAYLLDEKGDTVGAVGALEEALRVEPSYADAHFNLAYCLDRKGLTVVAARHWRAYLRHAPEGVWAEYARSRLYTKPPITH